MSCVGESEIGEGWSPATVQGPRYTWAGSPLCTPSIVAVRLRNLWRDRDGVEDFLSSRLLDDGHVAALISFSDRRILLLKEELGRFPKSLCV